MYPHIKNMFDTKQDNFSCETCNLYRKVNCKRWAPKYADSFTSWLNSNANIIQLMIDIDFHTIKHRTPILNHRQIYKLEIANFLGR